MTPRTLATSAALLLAVAVLPACSGDSTDSPDGETPQTQVVAPTDELDSQDGELCPPSLAFGSAELATSVPELGEPGTAAVCLYAPVEGEDAASTTWNRSGDTVEITGDDLTDISDLLGGLEPAEKDCAGKTGRRWLLSYEDGGDVTGVVLDDFACGQIRVTDAPFTDAPGDVLAAPSDLLTALKLIWIES